MGRYDGEDYSDEHYAKQAAARAAKRLDRVEELLRRFAPKEDHPIWIMATIGAANGGAFTHSEAVKALIEKASMTEEEATITIVRWLSEAKLWDWTEEMSPVKVHGVVVRGIEAADIEKLVAEYGEPAREAAVRAAQRERWYHLGSDGRTLARALWPEGMSKHHSTLHYSYGAG